MESLYHKGKDWLMTKWTKTSFFIFYMWIRLHSDDIDVSSDLCGLKYF